jgi:hypothetical protein
VRGYDGDLGETLSAGAALNRAGLGLDVRVGADAVRSRRRAGLGLGSEPGSGRRRSRHAGPACQRAEERREEAGLGRRALLRAWDLGRGEAPWPRKREGVGDGAGAHGMAGKRNAGRGKQERKGEREGDGPPGKCCPERGMKGRQGQAGLRKKKKRGLLALSFSSLLFFFFPTLKLFK